MREVLLHGVASADYVSLLARVALGGFYVLARFRWFYDPSRPEQPWFNVQRHLSLTRKIASCGFGCSWRLSAFVAFVEVFAGLGALVGAATMLSALGLLIVTLFATTCTAVAKIGEQSPVDVLDACCAYLWRVEGLYIVLALVILALGPGAFSLDAWVLQ